MRDPEIVVEAGTLESTEELGEDAGSTIVPKYRILEVVTAARIGSLTTEKIFLYTTYCPVSDIGPIYTPSPIRTRFERSIKHQSTQLLPAPQP